MVALGEVEMSGYHINPNLVHEVNGFGEHKAGKLGLNGTIKVRHYFHTLIPTIYTRKLYLFVTHLINMFTQNQEEMIVYKGAYVCFYLCTNETNFQTQILYRTI